MRTRLTLHGNSLLSEAHCHVERRRQASRAARVPPFPTCSQGQQLRRGHFALRKMLLQPLQAGPKRTLRSGWEKGFAHAFKELVYRSICIVHWGETGAICSRAGGMTGGWGMCCGPSAHRYFGDSAVFSYVHLIPHKEWKISRYSRWEC